MKYECACQAHTCLCTAGMVSCARHAAATHTHEARTSVSLRSGLSLALVSSVRDSDGIPKFGIMSDYAFSLDRASCVKDGTSNCHYFFSPLCDLLRAPQRHGRTRFVYMCSSRASSAGYHSCRRVYI
ncbi:hypothetical protein P5V15_011724 [Pogonomyrmex californicus]